MKKKRLVQGVIRLLLCGFSTLGIGSVSASEIAHPVKMSMVPYESGTVYYDLDHIYTLSGTKKGKAWSDQTASMAVLTDKGKREMVFCIQPGLPLAGGSTTNNYESIPTDKVSEKAQLASSLWTKVFPNKTQHEEMVARALVWENLPEYGIKVTSISGIPDFPQLKAKLSKAIDNYLKKPAFDGRTTGLTFGKTTTLDSGGVDLHLYDTVTENNANVMFKVATDGLSATVTPQDKKKVSGSYAAKSSFAEGTPIAWTKEGSQTVMISRIKNTANFLTKFSIQFTGNLRVKKVDEKGHVLTGAEFTLTDQTGKQTKKLTDENGLASFTIHSGNVYQLEETKTPEGFHGSFIQKNITVTEENQQFEYTAENPQNKGKIILHKKEDQGKPLADAEFTQYDQTGTKVAVKKTDKAGMVSFDIESNNRYEVKETSVPAGYHGAFDQKNITLTNDGQVFEYEAKNSQNKGKIILHKKEDQGKPLANAEFTQYDQTGTKVAVKKTDKAGMVSFDIVSNNRYEIKETSVPKGYHGTFDQKNITLVNDGQVFEYTAKNNQDKGKIILRKKEDQGNPLANAEFTLTSNGKTIARKKTDKNGLVTFDIYSNQAYELNESQVPEGFEGTFKKKAIRLKEDGQVFEYTAINNRKKTVLIQTNTTHYQTKGLIALVMAAVAGVISLVLYKKKRKESKQETL